MWCKKIMVAYDGSAASDACLEKAMDMAESMGAEIIALHVIAAQMSSPEIDGTSPLSGAAGSAIKDIEAKVINILEKFSGNKRFIPITGMSPSYVILEQVKLLGCDMIIMGSRGLTGIKEFLGSVSHAVVQHAAVPVMIVKDAPRR